jgi:hypothetical protein
MTTTAEKPLVELIQELSPELRGQVRDFAEFLLAKQRREQDQQAASHGWPEGFFDLAGSITDPTFVRPPQGEPEARLPLE